MEIAAVILGIGSNIVKILAVSWWAILPVGLFFIWKDFWQWGINRLWKSKIKWAFLEIKIPRNILKPPKAMENVFSALYAIYYKPIGFEDIYFKGKARLWFSCELAGYGGEVHFYIRCPQIFRNLAESAIYSEYPDAEIGEAEDYTENMPEVLPNETYDLWGADYILARENPYPIKTYEFFEESIDERRLDPIAAITEVMSRLKEGEAIWIQYLINPVPNEWKKEGEAIRDKMMERRKEKPAGFFEALIAGLAKFLKNLSFAAAEYPVWAQEKKKEEKFKFLFLSPGEKNILEGVDNKISKLGFEAAIRFIYIDRRDSYSTANVAAVDGAFRQFNTLDMNSFRVISETKTYVTARKLTHKSLFRKQKIFYLQRQIYEAYKLRWFPPKFSILNSEELATIFHFPLVSVEAPLVRRLETKKGEPPSDLPME